MSVEDQAEISRHIDIEVEIVVLKVTLAKLCQRAKAFESDAVPCAIEIEICHTEQMLEKEYAKLGISMADLPEKQKEAWK